MPDSPASQVPSKSKMGPNAWAGWETDVLADLGNAHPDKLTIAFLDWWQTFEFSKATNNPLNLTAPAGVSSINSAGVQSYATRQQGALYTAHNIQRNYPTLYNMLKNDKVKDVLLGHTDIIHGHLSSLQNLVDELNKWGSHNFADKLSGGTSAIDTGTKTGQNIVGKFTGIWDFLSNDWERILFVVGGSILIILAIIILAKQQQSNTFTFSKGGG